MSLHLFPLMGILFLGLLACKHEHKKGVIEKLHTQKDFQQPLLRIPLASLEALHPTKVKAVDADFLIPERHQHIERFPCSECHDRPLDKMTSKDGKKAHWNIAIEHASAESMQCTTCHNLKDMNNLVTLTKRPVNIDHSYKVCAQCHNRQFDDWKGGAHGKRLLGWTEPRVSISCVECHNPHRPKFDKRWPSWFNKYIEKQRKEPLK